MIQSAGVFEKDHQMETDVVIVGSGAGGSVLAAELAKRGVGVIVLERGGNYGKADFLPLREGRSFPMLYQQSGSRSTADLAVTILQGRAIGGGTTINWTTCFRTPGSVLRHWREVNGVEGYSESEMLPHFEAVEERLNIHQWDQVNANNDVLLKGTKKLGWHHEILSRNVKGCANSGYCGFGCPYDAKQAMHLTYLPDALEDGARVFSDCVVDRITTSGGRATGVVGRVVSRGTDQPRDTKIVVKAKVVVVSGGAINSPVLLLRSGLHEGPVGRRTFLHPVVGVAATYDHVIAPFHGAPQSVSSHQFIDRGPEKIGFFMELAPLHPMLAATAFPQFGLAHRKLMSQLNNTSAILGLCADGFLPGDEGGTVSVRKDGRPKVDYPTSPALTEAFREAHFAMAKIHLAAGAKEVRTLHLNPITFADESGLKKLENAPYGALEHSIFSAHQMGGCAMGTNPEHSVVDCDLRHHHLLNLFVVDGSVLPTSLGVNPSQTIYSIAHRAAKAVAETV